MKVVRAFTSIGFTSFDVTARSINIESRSFFGYTICSGSIKLVRNLLEFSIV